jgi:hypothetical protein
LLVNIVNSSEFLTAVILSRFESKQEVDVSFLSAFFVPKL